MESSPWYERAQKYLPKGPGAVLGFTLKGATLEQTRDFVDALKLHSNVANIGDVRSLVIHPRLHHPLPAFRRGTGEDWRVPELCAPGSRY